MQERLPSRLWNRRNSPRIAAIRCFRGDYRFVQGSLLPFVVFIFVGVSNPVAKLGRESKSINSEHTGSAQLRHLRKKYTSRKRQSLRLHKRTVPYLTAKPSEPSSLSRGC